MMKVLREAIIRWVSQRAPDFVITDTFHPNDPYMLRWYAIPRNRFFNIYVHRFLRSDNDEALHDHPWVNASWLLRGGYTEHTIKAGGVHVRTQFNEGAVKIRLSGKLAHRVELHAGEVWTCFFTGPVYRVWGFHCADRGWVPFKEFTVYQKGSSTQKGCSD